MYSDRLNIMYLRVAHKTENRAGVSAQRECILKFRQNHPELPEHFEEIIDEGYSGFDSNAPGLQKIIQLIKENKVAILIVSDLSHLTRDYRKAREYMEDFFPSHNVSFIVVNADDSSPEINLKEYSCQKTGTM